MTPDAVDESQLSSVAQALLKSVSEIASDPDKRVYAVMDGSQFNDLPRLLKQADISHRPLYRSAGGDPTVIVGGPWLVDPYQTALPNWMGETPSEDAGEDDVSEVELEARSKALSAQMVAALEAGDPTGGGMLPGQESDPALLFERLRKVIALSDGKPALVFWSGDGEFTGEKLYRHLRGLNRISVPKTGKDDHGSSDIDADTIDGEASRQGHTVIFRHADANVMMQIIPALDEVQVARLFGPASRIIFAPETAFGGGVKRAKKKSNVSVIQGVLQLTTEDLEIMGEIRAEASRRRRIDVFRRSAPHLLTGKDDHEALLFMEQHERQARSYGLTTERGFFQWTYLMGASDGRFIESPEIRAHLKSENPDGRLNDVMRLMASAAIEGARS